MSEIRRLGGAAAGIGLTIGTELTKNTCQRGVRRRLEEEWRPRTLWLCPPCTPWGSWIRYNRARSHPAALRERREQSLVPHFCAGLIEDQCRRGGRVVIEHP